MAAVIPCLNSRPRHLLGISMGSDATGTTAKDKPATGRSIASLPRDHLMPSRLCFRRSFASSPLAESTGHAINCPRDSSSAAMPDKPLPSLVGHQETSSGKKLSAAETEEMLATEAEETKESVRDAVLSGPGTLDTAGKIRARGLGVFARCNISPSPYLVPHFLHLSCPFLLALAAASALLCSPPLPYHGSPLQSSCTPGLRRPLVSLPPLPLSPSPLLSRVVP